jgi:uncharacterized protein (DUF2236 family)
MTAAPLVLAEPVRGWVGAQVRRMLVGEEAPAPVRKEPRTDQGLFGPDSVTWQIHSSLSMLIGGLRALMLQTLHPLAMAGVADHSDYRRDPWGRFHRTAAYIGTTTYGTTAEAEAIIAAVRRIHERITGTTPEGVPYQASNPHLLAWVHLTEVDSFLRAYRRYGDHHLSRSDADRYVSEMRAVGWRIGVQDPPDSLRSLRMQLQAMRPEMYATPQARETVRFLLAPPAPLAARPGYLVVAAGAVSLLPGFVRRELRLPVFPGVEPILVRPATKTLLEVLGWAIGPGTPPPAERSRQMKAARTDRARPSGRPPAPTRSGQNGAVPTRPRGEQR